MKILLLAKSSGGDSYHVQFENKEGLITAFCDCQAGQWGKLCKHKWKLLHGDESMLFDYSQVADLKTVASWAAASTIDNLHAGVEKYEKKKETVEKQIKKAKKILKDKLRKKSEILTENEFANAWSSIIKTETELAYLKYLVSKEKQNVEKHFLEGF